MHPPNPAWDDLGEDLWLKICQALPSGCHEAGAAWVERCRTLAAVLAVCSSLRDVVLESGALWEELGFRSAYVGLTQVGCPPAEANADVGAP